MEDSRSEGLALFIESLESRKLLSVALKAGVLSIRGTASADQINVRGLATRIIVQINGHTKSLKSSSVSTIQIDARGGNDRVDVRDLWPQQTVLGGAGNDTLLGSYSRSNLVGGTGKNKIKQTD